MKRVLVLSVTIAMAFTAAACTQDDKRMAGYGVGGAALGALAGGAIGKGRGALAGGAIGGAIGTYIGYKRTQNGVRYCQYRDRRGRVYEARCHYRR